MATKFGRVLTYRQGFSTHGDTRPFQYVVLQDFMENGNHYNSALTVLVTTKCRRVPTVRGVHLTMKSYETLILFLHEYVTNKKYWICATIMTITTKLGKVVKVVKEDISSIKLLDPSITLSCKVTGQIKYSLSKFYHLIIKFGKINILKFSMKPCFTKILYDVLSDTLTHS